MHKPLCIGTTGGFRGEPRRADPREGQGEQTRGDTEDLQEGDLRKLPRTYKGGPAETTEQLLRTHGEGPFIYQIRYNTSNKIHFWNTK